MATTTVFVDDVVQGHLPMVCVRSGAPADGLHRIDQGIGGGSGWAWLLIFFGPLGWLALLVGSVASGRTRYLTVRLPKTHAALAEERRWLRAAVGSGVVMVLAGIMSLVIGGRTDSPAGDVLSWVAMIVAAVGLLATIVAAMKTSMERVGIELDASGRWVTLRGVHPNFAAALDAQRASARQAV